MTTNNDKAPWWMTDEWLRDHFDHPHSVPPHAVSMACREILRLRAEVERLQFAAGYETDLMCIRKVLDEVGAPHDCEDGASLEPKRIRLLAEQLSTASAEVERLKASEAPVGPSITALILLAKLAETEKSLAASEKAKADADATIEGLRNRLAVAEELAATYAARGDVATVRSQEDQSRAKKLVDDIRCAINRNSAETIGGDTPDYLLAEFVIKCLEAFGAGTRARIAAERAGGGAS